MNFILDKLAIGNYEEALYPPEKITALLNVANEKDIYNTTLLYYKIPIIDMQPIPSEQMQEGIKWIDDHIILHNIMVFCNAGVGRSPSVVIGYLYCVLGYAFGEAVEFVVRRKPDISILPDLIRTVQDTRAWYLKTKNRRI